MQKTETYSVKEAARILNCSVVTIRRKIKEKQLDAEITCDKKGYRIPKSSLDIIAKSSGKTFGLDTEILHSFFGLSDMRNKLSEAERYMFDRCAIELKKLA